VRPRRARFALWFAPIIGATTIVAVAALASLEQSMPEVFVAASVVFSIIEGVVLAFIGCVWSSRGVPNAVLAASVTAVLAAPGRWEVARVRTGHMAQQTDLLADLALTLAWGAFAGLAGATVLRARLSALLPRP
jgi:hypothetical protein